jgi:hypothetical protein
LPTVRRRQKKGRPRAFEVALSYDCPSSGARRGSPPTPLKSHPEHPTRLMTGSELTLEGATRCDFPHSHPHRRRVAPVDAREAGASRRQLTTCVALPSCTYPPRFRFTIWRSPYGDPDAAMLLGSYRTGTGGRMTTNTHSYPAPHLSCLPVHTRPALFVKVEAFGRMATISKESNGLMGAG